MPLPLTGWEPQDWGQPFQCMSSRLTHFNNEDRKALALACDMCVCVCTLLFFGLLGVAKALQAHSILLMGFFSFKYLRDDVILFPVCVGARTECCPAAWRSCRVALQRFFS